MGANKPSGLLSSAAITRLVAQAAMGVAMGLAFTLLLVVINPSGVASLIQNGGGPAVFVGTLVTTFGIGATLSGAVFICNRGERSVGLGAAWPKELFPLTKVCVSSSQAEEFMMKTKLAIALLVATGLAGSPIAASAMSHKHHTSKHHKSMTTTTTGANMKSNARSGGSSQGNVGPGTSNVGGAQPGGR
jgi:hypothetical protein